MIQRLFASSATTDKKMAAAAPLGELPGVLNRKRDREDNAMVSSACLFCDLPSYASIVVLGSRMLHEFCAICLRRLSTVLRAKIEHRR